MTKLFRYLIMAPIVGFALVSTSFSEPFIWYANIETIPGCSLNSQHTGWIEISGIHHLVLNDTSGRVSRESFILTKPWGCSSPGLWQALGGTPLPGAVLELAETGGELRIMQRIEFEGVYFESIETAEKDASGVIEERIRLQYNRIRTESFCHDEKGPCASTTSCYDFVEGAPC